MEWFNGWTWVVVGLAGLVLLVYGGLPLLMRSTMWMRVHPDAAEDVTVHELPDDGAAWIDGVTDQLEELGFVLLGGLTLSGMVPGTDSVGFLYADPDEQTAAMATFIDSRAGSGEQARMIRVRYVEFGTGLLDGREVNTANVATPPTPDHLPEKAAYRLPGEGDLHTLYRLHQAVLRRDYAKVARKPLELERPVADWLVADMDREMRQKVERGAWSFDGERYRLTVRNAYAMTWCELPPFKQWRVWRMRVEAAQLRRDYLGS